MSKLQYFNEKAHFCPHPTNGISSESRYVKVLPRHPAMEDRLRRNTTDRVSQLMKAFQNHDPVERHIPV